MHIVGFRRWGQIRVTNFVGFMIALSYEILIYGATMKKFIISLLEIYIWIAIVIGIFLIVSITDTLGVGSGYIVLLFVISIPLIFGLIFIQIDNNQVLHEINDKINKNNSSGNNNNNKTTKKSSGSGKNDDTDYSKPIWKR